MRYKLTIPAAGQTQQFPVTGVSIIVESVNVYTSPAQVPLLSFNEVGTSKPLYPQAIYRPDNLKDGKFKRIVLTGTTESAGDTVYLVTTNDCLTEQLNANTAAQYDSFPGVTQEATINNTVLTFTIVDLTDLATGAIANAMYVQAQETDINYAYGIDPNQGTPSNSHKLFTTDSPLQILGINWMLNARFLNSGAGVQSTLIYTLQF